MSKFIASAIFTLLLVSGTAVANDTQGWKKLNGEQIKEVLEGASLVYRQEGGATQEFQANGRTTYVEGRPSLGEWKVVDSQYCSAWPPSQSWVCYDVTINDARTTIRFIGESGKIYEGEFK